MASTYPYSKLPDRSIRLLRLLPSRGRESPIHGKMICCPLPHDILEDGLYEALSYVWGSPDDPRCIHLQDDDLLGHGTTRPSSGVLSVTRNLHEALIRLRHAHVDRILWIDAICINQADIEERNQQVAIMAQIYATASRVLVWLGEDNGDGSEEALDEILAKAKETPDSKMKTSESSSKLGGKRTKPRGTRRGKPTGKPSSELIALLQRPWFRRVWILQEVAAARSILVMCGARTIDGHSFHLGVTAALQDVEQEKPPAAMRLMQDTFLRRYHLPADQGRFALGIAPLPDLLDSYMTSEATDPRDKVFALIGLASGDLVGSGLMADYSLALGELVKRLCSFCFGTALTVGCFGVEEQVALLRGTGHVLGRVYHPDVAEQEYRIMGKPLCEMETEQHPVTEKEHVRVLTFAKRRGLILEVADSAQIQPGDILLGVQGVDEQPKYMFVRRRHNYFVFICGGTSLNTSMNSPSALPDISRAGQDQAVVQHHLRIVWDWNDHARNRDKIEAFVNNHVQPPQPSHKGWSWAKLIAPSRWKEVALIMWEFVADWPEATLEEQEYLVRKTLAEYRKTPFHATKTDMEMLRTILPNTLPGRRILRFWRLKELASKYNFKYADVRESLVLATTRCPDPALDDLLGLGEGDMARPAKRLSSWLLINNTHPVRDMMVPVLAIIGRHRGADLLEAITNRADFKVSKDSGRKVLDRALAYGTKP